MQSSQFMFATCHPGLEDALLQEICTRHPAWRRAYSRPGFLTLKRPAGSGEFLTLHLARALGVSLGALGDIPAAADTVRRLWERMGPLQLHAWASGLATQPPPDPMLQALRDACPGLLSPGTVLRTNDPVLDIVAVDTQTVWLGWHRHGFQHSPHPGGCMPITVPPEAPSRAYGKTVEGLAWSGAALQAGDTVLELGSAPGGGTYALLERDLHVVAVDPAPLAPQLRAFARAKQCRLTHVRCAVAGLDPRRLPPVQWLLSDMNLAPPVVLRTVQRLVPALHPHLRGVLMNWKVNDLRVAAQLDGWLAKLTALGLHPVRVAHLGQHRREVVVWGQV